MWNVKVTTFLNTATCEPCINRNIVECKVLIGLLYSSISEYVLIETLWNVKLSVVSPATESVPVLIETLWNVKRTEHTFYNITDEVLIETLWNVKLYNSRKGIWSNVVLIETLWNVKQIASSVHP